MTARFKNHRVCFSNERQLTPRGQTNAHDFNERSQINEGDRLLTYVHLYRLIKDGEFVQAVALGKGRIAFVEAEVDEWLKQKAANRPAHRDATVAA